MSPVEKLKELLDKDPMSFLGEKNMTKILIKYARPVADGPDDFEMEESEDKTFDSIEDAIEFLIALKQNEHD